MTDQPNPYEPSQTETKGVLVGETKTTTSKRGIWFLLFMVFVVPLALIWLLAVVFIIYVIWRSYYMGSLPPFLSW